MKLGPDYRLFRASAAQVHGQWIFLCFRNPPVSAGMSGWIHGSYICNGRPDGWETLGMNDREPWSRTSPVASDARTAPGVPSAGWRRPGRG
jgi:hypothetical protein